MPVELSELSSISELLDQVTKRISGLAESAQANKDESTATELFGVERGLLGARRRLERLLHRR